MFDDGCYLMGHFTPKGWELGNSLCNEQIKSFTNSFFSDMKSCELKSGKVVASFNWDNWI